MLNRRIQLIGTVAMCIGFSVCSQTTAENLSAPGAALAIIGIVLYVMAELNRD